MMPPFVAVVGPTGTGKSALSLNLAERLSASDSTGSTSPAEVVNADAMQLYRGMNIGTAKLPLSERKGIVHHLLDVLDVTQESTVAEYQLRARVVIDEILARGAAAILVGGSGLYVSSVLYEFAFPGTDPKLRARLEDEARERGLPALVEQLRSLDPVAAESVDQHNPRRVIRALEIVELTGKPAQVGLPAEPVWWRPATVVGLFEPRETLVARLDERVRQMWRDGMLDEVRTLRELGLERGLTARRAIGYAQALAQLNGEMTEAEAIAEAQALTRRYARRQMSWFKRYPQIRWFRAGAVDLAERVLNPADPGDELKP